MERRKNWSLLVKPTHQCNLNCKYCFDRPMRERYGKLIMSYEILDKILKLSSEYAEEVQLIWHGGEPTTVGIDWYVNAQKYIYKHYKTKFNQSMQSNGILIDENWLKMANTHSIEIGMSFDVLSQNLRIGTGEVNLLDKAKLFKKYSHNFGTICVINKENYTRLIDMYNILKENGITGIAFNHIYRSEGSLMNQLELVLDEYINEYEKFFRYILFDDSEDAVGERSTIEIFKLVFGNKEVCCTNSDCRLNWIGVSPDGAITPCDRFVPEKYHMGNILDYNSIDEIYNSEGFLTYYNDIEKRFENHCNGCKYFPYCCGGCNGNHIAVSGDATGLDEFSCEQFKRKFNVVYDVIRDLDISNISCLNVKYKNVIIKKPAFTIKEIKDYLSEKKYNIEGVFDNENVKSIGEHLFDLDEYKLFRIFNTFTGEMNGHIDVVLYDRNYKENDMSSILADRKVILDKIYEASKEQIDDILGGV